MAVGRLSLTHSVFSAGVLLLLCPCRAAAEAVHYLDTAEVVGVCVASTLFGIFLVSGALYYNSKYPQHMSQGIRANTINRDDIVVNAWNSSVRSGLYGNLGGAETKRSVANTTYAGGYATHAPSAPSGTVVSNPYETIGPPQESPAVEVKPERRDSIEYGFDSPDETDAQAATDARETADSNDVETPLTDGHATGSQKLVKKGSFWRRRASAPTENSRKSSKKDKRFKSARGGLQISGPSNFQHVQHVGMDAVDVDPSAAAPVDDGAVSAAGDGDNVEVY